MIGDPTLVMEMQPVSIELTDDEIKILTYIYKRLSNKELREHTKHFDAQVQIALKLPTGFKREDLILFLNDIGGFADGYLSNIEFQLDQIVEFINSSTLSNEDTNEITARISQFTPYSLVLVWLTQTLKRYITIES